MKQIIYILLIGLICVVSAFAENSQTLREKKKILILNSYSNDNYFYHNTLSQKLKEKLLAQHSDIEIHDAYLGIDRSSFFGQNSLILRSALWSYTTKNFKVQETSKMAENLSREGLFSSNEPPYMIIFIGDAAWALYQINLSITPNTYHWIKTPSVIIGNMDSIPVDLNLNNMDKMQSIEASAIKSNSVYQNSVSDEEKPFYEKHAIKRKISKGDIYLVIDTLQITGVKMPLLLEKNLQLYQQLFPQTKEIVFVGSNVYTTIFFEKAIKQYLKRNNSDIKLSVVKKHVFNIDSLYQAVDNPIPGKIFLSNTWNINALYSKYSIMEVDSMFSNGEVSPMFSLSKQINDDNYWIGGYCSSVDECTDKTVNIVNRILNGEQASSIPFEKVEKSELHLNKTALQRFGLLKKAQKIPDVIYDNIPVSFYKKYKTMILILLIFLTILIGSFIYLIRTIIFNKKLKTKSTVIKKLSDKFQVMYKHTAIHFALYNKEGERIYDTLDITEYKDNSLFSNNLFSNHFLDEKLKEKIKEEIPVNVEVTIPGEKGINGLPNNKVFQLFVKTIYEKDLDSAHYLAIAVDATLMVHEREEKEKIENMVKFTSDISKVGIAYLNMKNGKGYATNSWYNNLHEPIDSTFSAPNFVTANKEDQDIVLKHIKDLENRKTNDDLYIKDIQIYGEDAQTHYVKIYIIYQRESSLLIYMNLNIDKLRENEIILNEARIKAEKSNMEKKIFLNNMNHEIRTPLNSIVGFSSLIVSDEYTEEEKSSISSIILKNGVLLKNLIDDILRLLDIDSGVIAFSYKKVELNSFFDEIYKSAVSTNTKDAIEINLDIPEAENEDGNIIYTDKFYLKLLIKHLISNALKFTKEGYITIGFHKESAGYYFFVKDTGCGIALCDQDNIFKRFEKVDTFTQGNGLGLSLCKEIAKHLCGTIGVISQIDEGSIFWLRLPFNKNSQTYNQSL